VNQRFPRLAPPLRSSLPEVRGGRRPFCEALRFRIVLDRCPFGIRTLVVIDRRSGHRMFRWHGNVVDHLVDCGVIESQAPDRAVQLRDKAFVQHLAMAATSARMAVERAEAPASCAEPSAPESHALDARLEALGALLDRGQERVARLLFAHPGHHFNRFEICCLLELEQVPVHQRRVDRWLEELVGLGLIQRIEVSADRVFYDIDTRPHLHVYYPGSGELRDAGSEGVIHAA